MVETLGPYTDRGVLDISYFRRGFTDDSSEVRPRFLEGVEEDKTLCNSRLYNTSPRSTHLPVGTEGRPESGREGLGLICSTDLCLCRDASSVSPSSRTPAADPLSRSRGDPSQVV